MNACLLFLGLCLVGAIACVVLSDRRTPALIAAFGTFAGLVLLVGALEGLFASSPPTLALWSLGPLGRMSLALDRLSAWFLLVAALVFVPVSVFSLRYLERYRAHYRLWPFGVVYFALLASIALTLLAADVLSFMIVWELMSAFAYLVVNYEHLHERNTRAGYVMLAAGEAGALLMLTAFLLLAVHAGRGNFAALREAPALTPGLAWAVFVLSFFGFGVKAGLFPSMSWLPRAHPAAAANASALLSGVILNLGIYGIVRVNFDLAPVHALGPGVVVLLIGAVSAIIGILYATTDNDLKRMLAHSSIENMGLIAVGLGSALTFRAAGSATLCGMALIAALFHLLNHSLYKSLLFLGAGSVDAATGTRDMDLLGGLARRMPWTGACFLAGCLAISALPPFNGFASEWLTLQSLLRSTELASPAARLAFAVAGALVALTAGLAVTAFVKLYAMSFLGLARSERAENAREVSASQRAALVTLAVLCLLLGLTPTYLVAALDPVASALGGAGGAAALVPPFFAPAGLPADFVADFHALGAQIGAGVLPPPGLVLLHRGAATNPVVFASAPGYLGPALGLALLLLWIAVRATTRARRRRRTRAWDGGLQRLLPEFTYSATGFSQPARVIFSAIVAPGRPIQSERTVAEHFRTAIYRRWEETYALDRWLFLPLLAGGAWLARGFAYMHHGRLNAYVGYALAALLAVAVLVYIKL